MLYIVTVFMLVIEHAVVADVSHYLTHDTIKIVTSNKPLLVLKSQELGINR